MVKHEAASCQEVYAHWEHLRRLAERRFPDTASADDAFSYLQEKFLEEDCRRVRAYRGEASIATFLNSVTYRLLEDFARQRYGRQKPPGWVIARGSLYQAVYRLLCWERMSSREVIEILRSNAPGGRPVALIDEAVVAIRGGIPHCGKVVGKTVPLEMGRNGEPQVGSATEMPLPGQEIWQEQKEQCLKLFGHLILSKQDPSSADGVAAGLADRFEDLRAYLTLTTEERLLLKLIYYDGLAVTNAGRRLGLNQNQVHGRLKRLLRRMRQAIKKAGLEDGLNDLRDAEAD